MVAASIKHHVAPRCAGVCVCLSPKATHFFILHTNPLLMAFLQQHLSYLQEHTFHLTLKLFTLLDTEGAVNFVPATGRWWGGGPSGWIRQNKQLHELDRQTAKPNTPP